MSQMERKHIQKNEWLFIRTIRTQLLAEWFREQGLWTAGETESLFTPPRASSFLRNGELTFLGHPFEGFGRAFDPILTVIDVGRKQPDHLIGAAGGRTRDIAGSKVDSFSNGELMFQRPLH